MTKPIIGLTARIEDNKGDSPPLNGVRVSYLESIVAAGGVPLVIPAEQNAYGVRELISLCSGLVLPGGADVDPRLYGETPHPQLGKVEAIRDTTEFEAIKVAREQKKPILGICRGHQVLNVAFGGTLFQDIAAQRADSYKHNTDEWHELSHEISFDRDSELFRILGKGSLQVNSLHHQAIKDLGAELRATAYSSDGLIEAVECVDDENYVIGLQCHPEVLWQHINPLWLDLFEAFVEQCVERS